MFSREMKIAHVRPNTWKILKTLIIIAKNWKWPRFPLVEQKLKKSMVNSHNKP